MYYESLRLAALGCDLMSAGVMTREMLEAFRADFGRLSGQRAKLEKMQRMRQWLQKRSFAGKRLRAEASDSG